MLKWEYLVLTGVNFERPTNKLQVVRLTKNGVEIIKEQDMQALPDGVPLAHLLAVAIASVGELGWELVSVDGGAWHFKRPVATPEAQE